MFTLAIEQSGACGSAAVLEGKTLKAQTTWAVDRQTRNRIYDAVTSVCGKSGVHLADIGLFAVGTGPGTYAGLRISNAVIHGLALPSGTPVIGVSSGEALARQLLSEEHPHISIVGDARRKRIWLGRFRLQNGAVEQTHDWRLVDFADLPTDCEDDERVAGPDWNSLEETLRENYPETRLLTESGIPGAEQVAQIALEHFNNGEPYPGSDITYMHPAVFVDPKFPAG